MTQKCGLVLRVKCERQVFKNKMSGKCSALRVIKYVGTSRYYITKSSTVYTRPMAGLGNKREAGYMLHDWDSIPGRGVDFAPCSYIQIGSGTHTTTHSKE